MVLLEEKNCLAPKNVSTMDSISILLFVLKYQRRRVYHISVCLELSRLIPCAKCP